MAYNTVETVGQDIYGFLDFLSRRQGPKDTTNPLPPQEQEKPQVASADAAVAPGATMPGTVMDAPPGPILPFQKPVPVSSKPVQVAGPLPALAGGGGAMVMPAGAAGRPMVPPLPKADDPEPPKPEEKKPVVPTTTAPGPALVSDPGGGPSPVPPPLGPAFKGGPNIPMFDPSSGKLDILGILKQQQDAANRANAISAIARGGTLMAAAATRSPSMRAVLANAAGHTPSAGGDGSGGGGAGGINAATLLELDKRSRGEAAAAYKAKIAPALAKHLGVPPEMIQYMDDDKIATLTTAIAKGENLDKVLRDDGSVIYVNKTTGQQFAGPSADQVKVRAAEDAHNKSVADTASVTEDVNKKRADLAQRALNEKNLPALSDALGVPVTYLQTLGEKLPEFVAERLKQAPPTESQKTLDGINKQRIAAGEPPISDEEWYNKNEEQKVRIAQQTSGYGQLVQAARTDLTEAQKNNEALRKGFITRNAARGPLDRGEGGIIAGSELSDPILRAKKIAQVVSGGLYKSENVGNTELYVALMADEVKNQIAGLGAGTGISDSDRRFAEDAAGGRISLTQETMKRLLAIHDNVARRQVEQNNERITRSREDMGQKVNDRDLMKMPPISRDELRYTDARQAREALLSDAGKQQYEFYYGADALKELPKRVDEMIQSKMQTRDDKTKTYKTFDEKGYNEMMNIPLSALVKGRDAFNQRFKDAYGDAADGLIDLLITRREQMAQPK